MVSYGKVKMENWYYINQDFDHKTNKIKIQYDGESHLIPLEELGPLGTRKCIGFK